VEQQQLFSPADLQHDFTFLLETLEAVHPNLYASTSPARVAAERGRIEQALRSPCTRRVFYRLAAPLVGALGDGHTFLHPPYEDFQQWTAQDGVVFPFDLVLSTDTADIEVNYSSDPDIPVGANLLAINDMPISTIINHLLPYSVGERLIRRLDVLEHAFRLLLWCAYDFTDSYTITLATDGLVQTRTIPGVNETVIRAQVGPATSERDLPPYA
jgi:hypothetical protein